MPPKPAPAVSKDQKRGSVAAMAPAKAAPGTAKKSPGTSGTSTPATKDLEAEAAAVRALCSICRLLARVGRASPNDRIEHITATRVQLSVADTPQEEGSDGFHRSTDRRVPKAERTVPYTPAEWEEFKKVRAVLFSCQDTISGAICQKLAESAPNPHAAP